MYATRIVGLAIVWIAFTTLNASQVSADLVTWLDTSAGGDGIYVFGDGTSLERNVSFTSSGTNVGGLNGVSDQSFNADGNWPFQNADDGGNASVGWIETGLSGPSNDAQLLIDFDGGIPVGTIFFAGQIFNTGTSTAVGSMSLELLDSTNSVLDIAPHVVLDTESYAGEGAGNETPVPSQENLNSIVLREPVSNSTNGGYRVVRFLSDNVDKIRLTFVGQGPSDVRAIGLAIAVPEPGSFACVGLVALGVVGWRKRRSIHTKLNS